MAQRLRHRLGGVGAIVLRPARHQPGGDVQRLIGSVGDHLMALAGAAAQHGIDEAGVFRRASIRLHHADREIDRGVIGNVHPEDLGRADQQRGLRPGRIGWHALVEQVIHKVAERAKLAQDRCNQAAHQRAITIRQGLQPGVGGRTFELFVERATLVQNAIKNIGGDASRSEAGNLGGRCMSYWWHGGKTSRQRNNDGAACQSAHHPRLIARFAREYAKCKNRLLVLTFSMKMEVG